MSRLDPRASQVWGIPPDGLTETITEPLVDLHGHGRKVTLLRFHPTANNVLGSVSGDFSVKVWDIEKGCEVSGMPAHEQLIQDLVWDYEGKMWATTCKDKKVRLGDPRAGAVAMELPEAHARAAKESEIPNFEGSFLGRFPLVSADFWTSDHLSERPRSVAACFVTRARGTLTLKRR